MFNMVVISQNKPSCVWHPWVLIIRIENFRPRSISILLFFHYLNWILVSELPQFTSGVLKVVSSYSKRFAINFHAWWKYSVKWKYSVFYKNNISVDKICKIQCIKSWQECIIVFKIGNIMLSRSRYYQKERSVEQQVQCGMMIYLEKFWKPYIKWLGKVSIKKH